VTLSNLVGSVTSNVATLIVNVPPAIVTQPTNQTVTVGQTATLSVSATGIPAPTYQWQRNGVNLAGATNATLTFPSVAATDSGSYTVVVSNVVGSATSNAVTLTVNFPPAIATQPTSQSVTAGQTATFSVTATGAPAPTYQWRKDGVTIAGATNASLTLTNAQPSDVGSYSVVMTNVVGTATSNAVTLTVGNPATVAITTQPISAVARLGQSCNFSVAATGAPAPTYQWLKDGIPIPGAIESAYTVTSASFSSEGVYSVVVTNPSGTVTSNPARLYVGIPKAPEIWTHPASKTVITGAEVTFSVSSGLAFPPATYQWRKDGVILTGATSDKLTISRATTADAGSYTVTLSNLVGSVTSNAATLTVNVPPAITTQPVNQTVTAGQAASLSVIATGIPAPTYQWRKGGVNLAGATNATLMFPTAAATDSGSYTVVVTNVAGAATSNAVTLTVNFPPVIAVQPANQTVTAGQNVTFSVTATGAPAPTYQWRKDGVTIAGATNASLTLTNAQPSDVGSYTVAMTNVVGTVTSNAVTLRVAYSRISNLSVRTNIASGQTLIVGFVTDGAKLVLVRAVGPGMHDVFPQFFGTGDVMANPRLELYNYSRMMVDENDNWSSSHATTMTSVGAFPLTPGSNDAAMVATVDGPYTVQLKGTGSGVVLVDGYDTTTSFTPRLKNISARNQVGTGANILIAGFVIDGNVATTLLIRGIGPALFDVFGVTGVLVDPKLEVYRQADGIKVAENDNWNTALTATFDAVGAYRFKAGSQDAALSITLPPGIYTAQLSGVGGTTGEGVVEVYEVP
jgi:hypothetical protein